MTFFLTYKRGAELVFASEAVAENAYQAQHRARLAMIASGRATRQDFAALRVRLTHLAEMPEGVRSGQLRKEFATGGTR